MKNIVWIVIAVIVLGGLAWWGLNQPKAADESGPVTVGVILPLTGDAAVYGEPMRDLIQMGVEEINAADGAGGRQIQLVIEDDKCDGAGAANAIQKLINVDKVQVVIGSACSGATLAAVPIAEQNKVALFSPAASSPKLTNVSPFFARNYPSDSAQGAILANIAYTDKGYKTVAFFQEQTDYAQGVYEAFKAEFEKLGGTVTNEPFPTETNDFRSLVTKVKNAKPDAVFLSVQTPAVGARIMTQMKQQNWKPQLFVADVIPGDPTTVAENKEMLEGAIGAEFGIDSANPKFQAMLSAYTAKFNKELPYQAYAQTEYDSIYLVREAIIAVGYDGTKIANWLRTSVKDWHGAAGTVSILENGEPAAGHRPEVIMGGKVMPYTK